MKNNCSFESYMEVAIDGARKSVQKDVIPIGCVITNKNGKVIAKSNNSKTNQNAAMHAEIDCINKACKKLNQRTLNGYSMYITLEPCTMCSVAISLAKIENLYIGTQSEKTEGTSYFESKECNHKPNLYIGINEKECSDILKGFFKNKR